VENFNDIADWKPKKLRTLRNNLNNRLASFKTSGEKAKDLQKGNKLSGLGETECQTLLKQVTTLLKNQK